MWQYYHLGKKTYWYNIFHALIKNETAWSKFKVSPKIAVI